MTSELRFTDKDLPDYLRWQILDFLRIQWPDGFEDENIYRNWIIHSHQHPYHFCLVGDNQQLISYVGVVWKELIHAEKVYKLYGLAGVFTYPQFRGRGHGLGLVKSARDYILQEDGDLLLLTTTLSGFYEKAGFIATPQVVLMEGTIEEAARLTEQVYLEAISDKSKNDWQSFIELPVYFGETVW